ncbi:hypothetical protein C8J57DRAFT_415587 [Mycena rebaudengoi]|nr:hypothetical protein C8J57DRAFT_415587 [Mycena rebaudengoi]
MSPTSSSPPDTLLSGIPQLPLEFFLASVLRPLEETQRQVIEQDLISKKQILNGRWAPFQHSCVAKNDRRAENLDAFFHIFDTVIATARDRFTLSPTIHLPPTACKTYLRLIASAPNTVEGGSWLENAIPFRLYDGGEKERTSNDKLITSCHDVLCIDHRRRFTFGISLDAEDIRIWFFSRSHQMVSEPVNFLSEPSRLIDIFLSLAFASPEQLGYDTSMSYSIDGVGKVQYTLALNGVRYITKKLLSDNRSEDICGRATRVWEAYREDDPDRVSVVIKDLWTSVGVVQEGSQLLELHDRLHALADPGTPRPPTDYFLTVLDHGFVRTSDGSDDHTRDVIMRGCALPTTADHDRHRKHYRIVFKELGEPVYDMVDMPNVMRALADATRALELLYKLGLVHRDVSAGNVLYVDGIGKLTDLEYLKVYNAPSAPGVDFGIGTVEFTAVEVAAKTYSFVPYMENPPIIPPFFFNPLHDLESTMWIALWKLMHHTRHNNSPNSLWTDCFSRAHPHRTVGLRIASLQVPFPSLPPSDPRRQALDLLNSLRRALHVRHSTFEVDFAGSRAFDKAHEIFIDAYEKAASSSVPTTPEKRKVLENGENLGSIADTDSPSLERPFKMRKSHSAVSPDSNDAAPPHTKSSAGSRKRRMAASKPPGAVPAPQTSGSSQNSTGVDLRY